MKIEFKYNNGGTLFDLSANSKQICEVFSKEVGFSDSYDCSLLKRNFFLAIFKSSTSEAFRGYDNYHYCSHYK